MRDQPTGPSDFPTNGHPTNGRPVNGHSVNGHSKNGHSKNGRVDAVRDDGTASADVHLPIPFRTLTFGDDAADGAAGALDLAVRADDELLDAVGSRSTAPSPLRPPPTDRPLADGDDPDGRGCDDRLVEMLTAWRAEIDADPIPELVDLDTAVATVVAAVRADELAARRRRAARVRRPAPLAAAAAILVALLGGIGLGAQHAVPGDPLWTIQKVVNPERAESFEAKLEIEDRLARARTALQNGDTGNAARELEIVRAQLAAVRGEEGRSLLVQEEEFLAAKLADTPPGTSPDLSGPPPGDPAARSAGAPPLSQGVTDPRSDGSDPGGPAVASGPRGANSAERGSPAAGAPRSDPEPADTGSAGGSGNSGGSGGSGGSGNSGGSGGSGNSANPPAAPGPAAPASNDGGGEQEKKQDKKKEKAEKKAEKKAGKKKDEDE